MKEANSTLILVVLLESTVEIRSKNFTQKSRYIIVCIVLPQILFKE